LNDPVFEDAALLSRGEKFFPSSPASRTTKAWAAWFSLEILRALFQANERFDSDNEAI
jgi:hypothetical protein